MTKAGAFHNFWSSFGLTAYEENAVPTGENKPSFPYLTYQLALDSFNYEVQVAVSLWYRSTSWLEINAKEREITAAIGRDGTFVPCDGGAIWIKRGHPFAQNMSDNSDSLIKRKYLNIMVEYLTED